MLELAIRVVVSLGVVLGLFWAVTRLGSRKLGGRDRALVRVRSRQALSRGSSLAVVEVGSRVLVVGVSDAGVRLLTELDPFELETDVSDLTELPVTLAAPQSVTELDGLSAPLSDGGSAGRLPGSRSPRRPRPAPRLPARDVGPHRRPARRQPAHRRRVLLRARRLAARPHHLASGLGGRHRPVRRRDRLRGPLTGRTAVIGRGA